MSETPSSDDEQRLAALLKPLDGDAPPPDANWLARLRTASVETFEAPASPSQRPGYQPRNRAVRILASLAAVFVLLAGVWLAIPPSQASVVPLGEVLAKLESARSLELIIRRDGVQSNVWIRQPGLVRWQDSPTKYRIARGSRLWRIDESLGDADNPMVATADSEPNPWYGHKHHVDLLSLLEIGPDDRKSLSQLEPSDNDIYAGKSCWVYQQAVALAGERYQLNAYVDRKTQQLLGITARQPKLPLIAELTLIALNPSVDESKFRIPINLAESDRIGKITDAQGMVTVRPVSSRRWTPVCRQMLLQPGDWLRTDVRGANAVTLELDSKVTLIVGPGSLVEVTTPNEARLHAGVLQIIRSEETPHDFQLLGLEADELRTFSNPGEKLVRLDRSDGLSDVPGKPVWLAGYEGSSAEDSLGSLIVHVDGREQSLSVGEHHVTVEIRDQIARTTIEETFVNHTARRLEGQFHFPLPQDASISGFGMWIGDELVEADIVEKQRAREIYETILREKRDPGLLEWAGGNLFKARVFPIEAHSEKRIKITYTQVLPLRGNRFRYSYALKSEMLQTNPLRELNINVQVNSAVPLAKVESPTHTCRIQTTGHAAALEFSAQEYIPTKDFEVVCEVDRRENDVVVIPHRRGEDGYFLMQLMPPGVDQDWTREVIPDGEPLELLLLCDTSGSMDSTMRRTQEQFVSALLASLGKTDRYLVAACDVDTVWVQNSFAEPSVENVAAVREFLDQRPSLGWTDLDRAFTKVLEKATSRTQIIYVGDGIFSTTESDPAEFVQRLKRIVAQRFPDRQRRAAPTLHAVSVSSTYESLVLKGIASHGGGSLRQISGETTPQETALELLRELAQPGLKDVQLEFRGLRVAAVYPEQLPNIAAGTQQILVGRYLPEGQDQHGEVVVTARQNGKPVKFVAQLNLAGADRGNSFIPRLWARGHLDALLQQGSQPAIQEEIIALSEEFHIITPYTSLLVLESDQDRERFGVKRRLSMRDGERFFADGRDRANYELRQQQMQRAGSWRIVLRRQILAKLASLGRTGDFFIANERSRVYRGMAMSNQTRTRLGRSSAHWFSAPTVNFDTGRTRFNVLESKGLDLLFFSPSATHGWDAYLDFDGESLQDFSAPSPADESPAPSQRDGRGLAPTAGAREQLAQIPMLSKMPFRQSESASNSSYSSSLSAGTTIMFESESLRSLGGRGPGASWDTHPPFAGRGEFLWGRPASGAAFGRLGGQGLSSPLTTVDRLFPPLPAVPISGTDEANSSPPDRHTESAWSEEALALSQLLLRQSALQNLEGGVEILRASRSYHAGLARLVPASQRLELWSNTRWLTRDFGQAQHPLVHWLDQEQRGVFSEAFLLGRVRATSEHERSILPLELNDFSTVPLHEVYRDYPVVVVSHPRESQAVLTVRYGPENSQAVRFTIDTLRNVLLKRETLDGEKTKSTITYSDFAQVAGCWWASRIITTDDAHGKRITREITQTVREYDAEHFAILLEQNLRAKSAAQLLSLPLPTIRQARQRHASGSASLEDHLVLLQHAATYQNWKSVFDELRSMEAVASRKEGLQWLRIAVELAAGRREEARQHLFERVQVVLEETLPTATELAGWEGGDLFLAMHTLDSLYSITDWNEYGKTVEKLRPVYARQTDAPAALLDWKSKWLSVLDHQGRSGEAFRFHAELAADAPGDLSLQISYATRLADRGEVDESLVFLKTQLSKEDHWNDNEHLQLRERIADTLEQHGRYEEVLSLLENWLADESHPGGVYRRYLTALVMNDRVEDAEAQVRSWIQLAIGEAALSVSDRSRTQAAVQFCLGQGHRLSRHGGLDPRWLALLYETAAHCLRHPDRLAIAQQILDDNHFVQTDEADRLRGHVLAWLKEDLRQPLIENDTDEVVLPVPLAQLEGLLQLLRQGRLLVQEEDDLKIRQVTRGDWELLADGLLKWWEDLSSGEQRRSLSASLLGIYGNSVPERRLPFLRRRVQEASPQYITLYRHALFDALLAEPWSEELEAEAFAMWPLTVATESRGADGEIQPVSDVMRTWQLAPKLYRLVDAMLQNRLTAVFRAQQDAGQVDQASRTERAARREQAVRRAREELAARLQQEWESRKDSDSLLPHWIMAERIYLDIQLDRHRDQVLQWAWDKLGAAPPAFQTPEEISLDSPVSDEEANARQLDTLLRQRAWTTVMSLIARRDASDELIAQVLDYIHAGITNGEAASSKLRVQLLQAGDDETDVDDWALGWKIQKYEALLLLDRPEELVEQLQQWVASDRWNVPWKKSLARLHAERGDLSEAVALFESLEKDGELTSEDYSALADWQLVLDRRDRYDQNRMSIFQAMPENQLSRHIRQAGNRLHAGNGPHELEDDVLLALTALFEKTTHPNRYFQQARSLYTSTRDFRLLAMIPESILGKTRQSVYSSLQSLRSTIVEEIRDEATTDEMLVRVRNLRKRLMAGEIPRGADANERSLALDLRALDLVESMIERRAADVLNQPGPHVQASLSRLRAGFDGQWQEGERLQYAQFLQSLGAIRHERDASLAALANEQLRQVHELSLTAEPGSLERMRIGQVEGLLLFNAYARHREGLLAFEGALREYANAHGGRIPYSGHSLVTSYSSLLQQRGAFLKAEEFVQKQIEGLSSESQRWIYEQHLNSLYERALRSNGRTSLGEKRELFDNLLARLLEQCNTQDDNRRYALLQKIGTLFSEAIQRPAEFSGLKPQLLKFASEELPHWLQPQHNQYGSLVQHFGNLLDRHLGPLEALSFLLARYTDYPLRYRYVGPNPWHQHHWQLADFRLRATDNVRAGNASPEETSRLIALEKRLLPIVLEELRRHLLGLQSRNDAIFYINQRSFWAEKQEDFRQVAESVLKQQNDSPRTVLRVAQYFYDGLFRFDRAIEILWTAHRRGMLDHNGTLQLVDYLHSQTRYAESVPVLESLVEKQHDTMDLRVLLMRAYFHAKRPVQLNTLLSETDQHFHQDGRWQETNILGLARIAAETQHFSQAAGYFEEAISLHQRSQPNQGVGNGILSGYYEELASAYSGLGETEKAVNAAAASVVSWGRDQNNRQMALNRLQQTIRQATNLDAFLRSLDQKAQETGQDSPLIRKMVGLVLQESEDFRGAVEQLELSLEFQPYDREVHQALIQCFDQLEDHEAAVAQLLAQIDFDRHNSELYHLLVEHSQEDAKLAERAATSIVESAPNEAESHQALAMLREENDRWQEAIRHWRRVAELRRLEPTGLLGLAKAQLQVKDTAGAKKTIKQLRSQTWPTRFGDVEEQIRQLPSAEH